MVKKSSFGSKPETIDLFLETKMGTELAKKLNWNERTSYLVIEKYIFINAHMSSKGDRNKPQLQALREGLVELKEKLPAFDIVVGGDLNAYL